MAKTVEKKAWDSDENEASSSFASFAQEGDYVYGALLAPRRQVANKLAEKPGTMQFLYEMKVHDASFHRLDKKKKVIAEAETPDAGSTIVIGGKAGFDYKLAGLKVGQLFGLKFVEEKEATVAGRNPTKIFKAFLPKDDDGEFLMDEDVKIEAASDEEGWN